MNQRHSGVEKLTAILPRAKTKSRSGRSAAATENGGRRGSYIVRRGLAVHRKHEIANKESQRLRKGETRLGMKLTGQKHDAAENRARRGSWRSISARTMQRPALGFGRGVSRGSGRLFKGAQCAGQGSLTRIACGGYELELESYPDTR